MSAELLRRAAKEMRERAEAATPGLWGVGNGTTIAAGVEQSSPGSFAYDVKIAEVDDERWESAPNDIDAEEQAEADAKHIASWHPAVALAVADVLDQEAEIVERANGAADHSFGDDAPDFYRLPRERFLAVARAYLGETA